MPPYTDKGTCPEFVSYSSAVTEGWRALASRTLLGSSEPTLAAAPVKGKALGQIIAVVCPPLRVCSSSHCHPFPKCLLLSPSPPQPHERGAVPWRSCPGQSEEPWAAVTATVLRQLCKGVSQHQRGPAAAPAPLPRLGHLLLPFCSKVMNIFIFLDELAQSPASYVPQKLNP